MRPVSLLLLVGATACAPKAAPPAELEPETTATVRTPPLDDRAYRAFQLDNGMKALVISDPTADMAAAALDVHVGQFSDPPDREGLAHFLEHMLFLGTDAYPDVDAYRDFVQSHGGGSNAGTGQEHTRYHFDIEHGHLEGGLDRFSAFFTSPRLDREYVAREREAVNSEYRLKVQTQVRRFREVRRATSNPAHGFSKFSVGNLDTLADRPGDAVWDDLRSFYDTEYSASRMAVSVLGRQDLDTLEGFVRDRFEAVPTTGEPAPESSVPIYLPEQIGVRIHVEPLDEIRELYLEFPMPPELETHTRHPLDLLTGLVGQEGPGSPHDLLTERGWITRLSTATDGAEDHSLFTVRVSLTEAGLANVDAVAGVVFQYSRLLRAQPDLKPYWSQARTLSELAFQFAEAPRASATVRATARAMQLHPTPHLLDHWATWDAWDAALLDEHLARVRPDNARVFVTAPGLPTDQVEPYYSVPYRIQPLDPATMQAWSTSEIDPALAVPPLNPFVPKDVSLLADEPTEDGVPTAIIDEPGLEVWHLQDTAFGVPRAHVAATLHLPHRATTLADKVNLVLWRDLVQHHLAAALDQARAAGVTPRISRAADGLYLEVHGYDDTLDAVLDTLVEGVRNAPLDADTFELHRRNRLRQYRNTATDRPIDQVGWALSEALEPTDWSYVDGAAHLEQLDLAALEAWRTGLFDQLHVEVLVHGNLSADAAARTARAVRAQFPDATPVAPSPVRVRQVPPGRDLVRTVAVDHADSALRVLYQGSATGLDDQARWLMLGTLMKTPVFTQLRTEQQLGYVVWGGYDRRDHVPGISVNLQSGVADPTTLLTRVEAFLDGFGPYLSEMTEPQFETVKAGLVASLEEAPTSLRARSRELERDLALGATTFDRKAQLVARLAEVDKAEVEALFATAVRGEAARRLVVQATGRAHAEAARPAESCPDTACVVARLPEAFERAR